MNVRHGFAALFGGVVIGFGPVPTPTAIAATKVSAARAGGACPKAKATTTIGTTKLICTKSGNKLRWQVDPTSKKSGATATVAPTSIPAATVASSTPAPTTVASSAPTSAAKLSTVSTPATTVVRKGSLVGAGGYQSAGRVELSSSDGIATLAFVDAAIQNGPSLSVYLTPRAGGSTLSGALKLGQLKAQNGDFSYEIPSGTDPAGFGGVLIWCDRFAVPFGTAPLS